MTSPGPVNIEIAQRLIKEQTLIICDDRLVPDPQISVCLVTFNHRSFIEQALQGALEQTTSVPFEIVIGDDCSDDGTTEIVRRFQKQHPECVRVLLAERNLGQHTGNGRLNFIRTLQNCRGKYVAMIDGDDYWTSSDKLQKQFDALEANSEWGLCFHRAQVVNEKPGESSYELPGDDVKEKYTLTDILAGNFMATATVMFRNAHVQEIPDWYYSIRFGDWPLHVHNACHGDIGFLSETMTVHRIHEQSTFSSKDDGVKWRLTFEVFESLRRALQQDYDVEFAEAEARLRDRMFTDMTNLRISVDRLRNAHRHLSDSLQQQILELQTGYESCLSMRVGRAITWPVRVASAPFRSD